MSIYNYIYLCDFCHCVHIHGHVVLAPVPRLHGVAIYCVHDSSFYITIVFI